MFDQLIDEGLKNLMINEWFDICRKYCRVQLIIWSLTKKTILFKASQYNDSDDDANINFYDHKHYPVVFTSYDSQQIFKEQARLKHMIQNIFSNVEPLKPVGDLDLVPIGKKKTVNSETIQSYKQKVSLLQKIKKFCNFDTNKQLQKKQTTSSDLKPCYKVRKPIQQPVLRCITDREVMQMLINSYFLLLPVMRTKEGKLLQF